MRVPVNYEYCSKGNHQDQPLVPSMAAVKRTNYRRDQVYDNVGSTASGIISDVDRAPIANPSSTSPPAAQFSSRKSPPPELPSFLQDPNLNRTYARGRYLGEGGFAWCYEVTDVRSRENYALKVVVKSAGMKQRHRDKVMREISIHQYLLHENVVRLHSSFEDDQHIYMVLELCHMDSLVAIMKKCKVFTEEETRFYMSQFLSGVRYLHENAGVLHRDLKLGNMLLTNQRTVKIADFGLALSIEDRSSDHYKQLCGTPNYISPEVLRKEGYSRATEAWAIGCTMYAMLVGKPPFESYSIESTYEQIISYRYSYPPDVHVSNQARNLIDLLLNRNPAKRPTAAAAMSHEFFAIQPPRAIMPSPCYPMDMSLFDCPSISSAKHASDFVSPQEFFNDTSSSTAFAHPGGLFQTSRRNDRPFDDRNHLNGGTTTRTTSLVPSGMVSLLTDGGGNHNNAIPNFNIGSNSAGNVTGPFSSMSVSTSPANSNATSVMGSTACPFDSYGNTTFGSTEEAALTQWLRDVNHALRHFLRYSRGYQNGSFAQTSISTNSNVLYVTKWIDYSNYYGFGCEFNNGAVSIMQNDNTRLCLSADRRYCRRWQASRRNSSCYVNGSDVLDLGNPQHLTGPSRQVVQYFVDYMDTNLLAGGFSAPPPANTTSAVPFIILWRRLPDSLLLVFSDGTFQVNFISSHTKVVFSQVLATPHHKRTEAAITVIDETRLARTCSLKNAIGSLIDATTLQSVRRLLVDEILPSMDCFVAEI